MEMREGIQKSPENARVRVAAMEKTMPSEAGDWLDQAARQFSERCGVTGERKKCLASVRKCSTDWRDR